MKTSWQIEKIMTVTHELQHSGTTTASTGEQIAAAFVLNNPAYLPAEYTDLIEAWDYLGDQWQASVRLIKKEYRHLIQTK